MTTGEKSGYVLVDALTRRELGLNGSPSTENDPVDWHNGRMLLTWAWFVVLASTFSKLPNRVCFGHGTTIAWVTGSPVGVTDSEGVALPLPGALGGDTIPAGLSGIQSVEAGLRDRLVLGWSELACPSTLGRKFPTAASSSLP